MRRRGGIACEAEIRDVLAGLHSGVYMSCMTLAGGSRSPWPEKTAKLASGNAVAT